VSPVLIAGRDYFTPDELRAMFPAALRPSAETLRRRIANGDIGAVKFGPSYLISANAIHAFLDPSAARAQETAVTADEPKNSPTVPDEARAPKRQRKGATRHQPFPGGRSPRPSFRRALALESKRLRRINHNSV
jgi:excisionase family DNA binding protein